MKQFFQDSSTRLCRFVLTIATVFFTLSTAQAFSVEEKDKATTYIVGINEPHQFIWFRVAKVGTSTIRNVLKKNRLRFSLYEDDFTFNAEKYEHYFKFAFIRNP